MVSWPRRGLTELLFLDEGVRLHGLTHRHRNCHRCFQADILVYHFSFLTNPSDEQTLTASPRRRAKLVELVLEHGEKLTRTAAELGIHQATASYIVKNFKNRGTLEPAKRSGRPRLLQEREIRRLVRAWKTRPHDPWRVFEDEFNVHASTIRRVALRMNISRRCD